MKKYVVTLVLGVVATVSGLTAVFAGYNLGPNNIFHMDTKAGTSIKGLWVEGTMSNGTNEAYNYQKQVYARSGASGTYSEWAKKSAYSITHRDYGAFGNQYSEVRGYWKK